MTTILNAQEHLLHPYRKNPCTRLYNKIITSHGSADQYKLNRTFEKFHYNVIIRKKRHFKIWKELITRDKIYGIHFKNQILEEITHKTLTQLFGENNAKINKMLYNFKKCC